MNLPRPADSGGATLGRRREPSPDPPRARAGPSLLHDLGRPSARRPDPGNHMILHQAPRRGLRPFFYALIVLGICGAASVAEPPAGKTSAGSAASKTPKIHRIVVQLTADGEDNWNAAINQIENLKKGLAPDSVE